MAMEWMNELVKVFHFYFLIVMLDGMIKLFTMYQFSLDLTFVLFNDADTFRLYETER